MPVVVEFLNIGYFIIFVSIKEHWCILNANEQPEKL